MRPLDKRHNLNTYTSRCTCRKPDHACQYCIGLVLNIANYFTFQAAKGC